VQFKTSAPLRLRPILVCFNFDNCSFGFMCVLVVNIFTFTRNMTNIMKLHLLLKVCFKILFSKKYSMLLLLKYG
jgi:hypothetical protein